MMRPRTHVILAARAAMRRRYAYVALRLLDAGLVKAFCRVRGYDENRRAFIREVEAIAGAYRRGLKRIEKKWPKSLTLAFATQALTRIAVSLLDEEK
jgi:hypothetical protein